MFDLLKVEIFCSIWFSCAAKVLRVATNSHFEKHMPQSMCSFEENSFLIEELSISVDLSSGKVREGSTENEM